MKYQALFSLKKKVLHKVPSDAVAVFKGPSLNNKPLNLIKEPLTLHKGVSETLALKL